MTLVFFLPVCVTAKESWQPATAQELSGTKSTFEPDAPAEALVYNLFINDESWPRERRVELYVRYKIYDPEKAERLMRLSEPVMSYDGYELREVDLEARLYLPDGTVRKFGSESVHERDMLKKGAADSFWRRFFTGGGLNIREKFLAVGGAVPGAILEYRVGVNERQNERTTFHYMQFESIPVRQATYRQKLPLDRSVWVHALYGLNSENLEVSEDKSGRILTARVHDLRSLPDEPMSGPAADRAVTLADCYVLRTYTTFKRTEGAKVTGKFSPEEPWAPLATIEYWWAADHISLTDKIKKTAAEVTQGAGTDLEKARRIHDFVQSLHQKYLHGPPSTVPGTYLPVDMDDVLDLGKEHPVRLDAMDFLWLAISLDRAAGLEAEDLMLPDRGQCMFSRQLVAPAFLPARAVAVRAGGTWHFSMPQLDNPLAFDELPWTQEGFGGLLARDHKQDFIEVPFSTAEQALVRRTGDFRLDASGTLTGEGTVAFHGHEARLLRAGLAGQTREAQLAAFQHTLAGEFEGADVEVTELHHLDEVYEPLEFRFRLNWPGYGVVTGSRMIIRSFVFRASARSPFASSERRNVVVFPFRRKERDEITIALPAGFEIEAKEAPPSFPGKTYSYQVDLGLDRKRMILHVSRDFSAGVIMASPKDYPGMKSWYDAVTLSDQHSLVLVQAAGAPPVKSPAGP